MSLLRPRALGLFVFPDYRRLWAAGALTGIARWLEFIALGIFAYELTQSPKLVALLAVLRMMPYVLLGFVMGVLADRFDRRRLLMAATAVVCLTATGMAIFTGLGHASYTAVAVATMVSGAFWTIDMPVRRRLLVDAAGPDRVASALGFDNSTMYATRALGPLIGGASYQAIGISGIYCAIAVAYAACFILAARLGRPKALPTDGGIRSQGGVLAAFHVPRELIFNRRFSVIMGVTLTYNLFCFPFTTMIPVIAQRDFSLPPELVGALSACDGVGGTIGALLLGILGSERTLFRTYFGGTLAMLLLMLALSFHLEVQSTAVALLLMGAAAACFSATQYALVHVIAPPAVRGRATGVLSLFIGSSMIGHYMTGVLFDSVPSPIAMRTMALCGIATMLVCGAVWWTTRDRVATIA